MVDYGKVLIVDDEQLLADLLAQSLSLKGWECSTVYDGFKAVMQVRKELPDAVILDVMLPGIDGFEVLAKIKREFPQLPILMLTARDDVSDRVRGLRSGADDYVVKPFDLEEVAARLEVICRRREYAEENLEDNKLEYSSLRMDLDKYTVSFASNPLTLTKTEFELCKYLILNAGNVVRKEQILDQVWNYDFGGNESIVELYISYLRKKLAAAGAQNWIKTIRGVGYMLMDPVEESRAN